MLRARDVMTEDPAYCIPETSLQEAAELMLEKNCGELPVMDSPNSRTPIGVITDRDIVCRAVAQGKDIRVMSAGDCMSTPCITINADATLESCVELLEASSIRRLPVVDDYGECCGIISQADIARVEKQQAAERVHELAI